MDGPRSAGGNDLWAGGGEGEVGGGSHAVTYLLLNVLFGGLPHRLGADVEGTGLTLPVVREPVDRLMRDRLIFNKIGGRRRFLSFNKNEAGLEWQ